MGYILGPVICIILVVLANFLAYFFNNNSRAGQIIFRANGLSTFFASNSDLGPAKVGHGLPQEFWAFDVLSPHAQVSSHFLGSGAFKDWTLLAVHFLTLSWVIICIAVEQTQNEPLSPMWLTWFTHWTLVLLSLAGGIALANQARYMYGKARPGPAGAKAAAAPSAPPAPVFVANPLARVAGGGGARVVVALPSAFDLPPDPLELDEGPPVLRWDPLSALALLSMQMAITASLFLDVYYWAVLVAANGGEVEAPATILKHAANLCICLLEVLLTRMPIVSNHFQAVIGGALTCTWRYGLHWIKKKTVVMYFAIPIAMAGFHILWWGIALLRERVGRSLRARAARRAEAAAALPSLTSIHTFKPSTSLP
ncbi:hypothetical protein HYH03_015211 [Edaphochlamys debaryana]|uniref:Uncharacterized protein n=1 Tax=Edaphochlamys debaryana TaxID=47281 RepID=A0A836BR68_9CHLO|nr:hypothetical protein HYH03_015211 [Edaphochlamys debaryana]|eukprot:KAG2486116.1 hypothetical protein HYH03_015211 [Edaphochlamys debaryana]